MTFPIWKIIFSLIDKVPDACIILCHRKSLVRIPIDAKNGIPNIFRVIDL